MLQNKVSLEHMLKMASSSIQALLYVNLQIGEHIGNGSNIAPYGVFMGVNCSRLIVVYTALQ
jgi:hypothetical protein